VYDLTGGSGPGDSTIIDFEGRTVVRAANSLKISGDSAAHIIVRWRFSQVRNVTVNGTPVKVQTGDGGELVEFDHLKESTVAWQ